MNAHSLHSGPGQERRDASRMRTVHLVARARVREDWGLVRVLNVSDEGAMISTRLALCPGDAIEIDLSESCSLHGVVAWGANGRCGLKLNEPIDSAALLARLHREKAVRGSRPLRIPMLKGVMVSSEAGLQLAQVRDISQSGVKLEHNGRLRQGMRVKVQFSPEVARRGVVRWSGEQLAGVQLTELISVEELGSAAAF